MSQQNGFCHFFVGSVHKGFTVIEFAVTLALVGIGLGLAIPSLQSLSANNQVVAAGNAIVTGMNLAKSGAITSGDNITICPTNNGTSCLNGAWDGGWIVFNDINGNGNVDNAEVIRVLLLDGNLTQSGFGNIIVFQPNGTTALGSDATITTCYADSSVTNLCQNISVSTFGMIQSSEHEGVTVPGGTTSSGGETTL